jgi:hypothetical protein
MQRRSLLFVLTISVLLATWSAPLLPQAGSPSARICAPEFKPIALDRSLPSAYVDQALQSIPQLYPAHVLLAHRRHSETGPVAYSLIVYGKDAEIEEVTIEGVAVHEQRAWEFHATCPLSAAMDAVLTTIERVGALHRQQPNPPATAVAIVADPAISVIPTSARPRPMMDFFDSRRPAPLSVDLSLRRCVRAAPPRTLAEVLGPGARRIVVRQHTRSWRNLAAVSDYIRRVLPAAPEGGQWSPFQVWSEGNSVEIEGWIESSDGPRRPFELSNGYAHAMDASGCQWWARVVGR